MTPAPAPPARAEVVLKLYSVHAESAQQSAAHSAAVVMGLPMGPVAFDWSPQHSWPASVSGNVCVRLLHALCCMQCMASAVSTAAASSSPQAAVSDVDGMVQATVNTHS